MKIENQKIGLVGRVPGPPFESTNGRGHGHRHPEYCHLFLSAVIQNYYNRVGYKVLHRSDTAMRFSHNYRSCILQFVVENKRFYMHQSLNCTNVHYNG